MALGFDGDGEAHGSSCITLVFPTSFRPQACGSSGMSNHARNQEYASLVRSLGHHLTILLCISEISTYERPVFRFPIYSIVNS